jgi:hypothetical protein
MTTQVATDHDTQAERQERIAELNAENAQWQELHKPGSFGCHELLDRTLLLADQVEQLVLSHPACVRDPHWYALAEQAVAALHELYQCVGAEHVDRKS